MSQDEPVDGPTGEYRKETVKKLEIEKEVDTADRDTSNGICRLTDY
jgi:tRNA U34 2-thiouridine synthase MnmA/TrmU